MVSAYLTLYVTTPSHCMETYDNLTITSMVVTEIKVKNIKTNYNKRIQVSRHLTLYDVTTPSHYLHGNLW